MQDTRKDKSSELTQLFHNNMIGLVKLWPWVQLWHGCYNGHQHFLLELKAYYIGENASYC